MDYINKGKFVNDRNGFSKLIANIQKKLRLNKYNHRKRGWSCYLSRGGLLSFLVSIMKIQESKAEKDQNREEGLDG